MNKIIFGLLSLMLSACGDTCMLGMGNCDLEAVATVLALTPAAPTVAKEGELTVTASGGTEGYTIEQLVGSGDIELSDDRKSITFTAPNSEGWTCFRVTDSKGATDDACVEVVS